MQNRIMNYHDCRWIVKMASNDWLSLVVTLYKSVERGEAHLPLSAWSVDYGDTAA
jgi:hypothetical protein